MSNLQLRTISAIVLAVAVLALTWLGGLPFRVLSAVIVLGIFYEWSRMARPKTDALWGPGVLGMLPEIPTLVFAGALVVGVPATILLGLVVVFTLLLWVAERQRGLAPWESSGFAYAALSGLALALLRGDDTSGLVAILCNYAISGASPMHWAARSGGVITADARTVTLSGTPAFATAFASNQNATVLCGAMTFSGSATGVRYSASLNGAINAAGGGANYLPGNAAGSTATGGQYA